MNVSILSAGVSQFSRKPDGRTKGTSANLLLLIIAAGLALAPARAEAVNLLSNPGFESNSGHAIPAGWTRFAPPNAQPAGNYWILTEAGVAAHSGTLYFKEWGASYLPAPSNNVAGIYQDLSSTPGSIYQANGWLYARSTDAGGLGANCIVWLEVSFLGASSNTIALYKSADFTASVGFDSWFQFQVTNACDLSSPVSTGDPYYTTYAVTGSVSQLVAPLGTTTVRYRFAYLQSGMQGGSCYFDDAVLDQVSGPIPPVISNFFPLNMIFVNPADGISFNVRSPSGFTINSSAIGVVVNGTNVSGSLAISGSSSNKNVTYSGLLSNLTYTASITVTDSFGFTASANTYFETTWVGIDPVSYIWEAEDFDFTNGVYINNPDLCDVIGNTNCYFGKVGVEGTDEHNQFVGPTHQYRSADPMGTAVSGDYLRKNFFLANKFDYKIDPFNGSEWVNYTRDWPNSTNWVVARLATGEGLAGTLTLSRITSTTTNELGIFKIDSGQGWSSYQNVYLKDTNDLLVSVILNGEATLRVTSGGYLLPGFFALVPALADLPQLSNLKPTGARPFGYTNALSFTVTSLGATFPANSIKLNLDGSDVSASLVITGPASTRTVVYPALQLNAMHSVIITATNSLGHGIRVTNSFDTFSQNNYMVEAEDFDYEGGQYISAIDWVPDAYQALFATTNIDYQHSTIEGELYPYRNGIPQSLVQNYAVEARLKFVDSGAFDYQLDWFGIGDWANYTGNYPTGNFFVYIRSAGLGATSYSMDLDQVVSGAGTTSQVTKRLGRWGAVGRNQQTYAWVPLTDDGLAAPAVVKLGGVNTLRISTSTGLCYPNYFMLVPASGISLSAARSGTNVNLSFPTQAGASYRVFYRADLTTGNWLFLTTVLGDGTVKSVSSPTTGSPRFFKVTSP